MKQLNLIVFSCFLTVLNYVKLGSSSGLGKMKLNLGVHMPSMTIKMPKLELPQITISATIKQRKKPFKLHLPSIHINANTNPENEYGGEGGGYEEGGSYEESGGGEGEGGYEENHGYNHQPKMNHHFNGGHNAVQLHKTILFNQPRPHYPPPHMYRASSSNQNVQPAVQPYMPNNNNNYDNNNNQNNNNNNHNNFNNQFNPNTNNYATRKFDRFY